MEQFRQAAKRIDASDVVSLLREVYPEGVRGRNEAEALLSFDREFSDPAPEWRGFMAEAVADHLLRRSEPLGIVTDEKADWLIHAIAPSGRIATRGGAQTLIRTVELADGMPSSFAAFAIRELWREVIVGEAPVDVFAGQPHVTITVVNRGDRDVQVRSQTHFFETNPALEFDRRAAWGRKLAVASGAGVRFEPGIPVEVTLVPMAGDRVAQGFSGLVNGSLDATGALDAAMAAGQWTR